MKKNKIILITTFYFPEVGGVEKQCLILYEKLKALNFEIKVFTTDASHSIEKRLPKKDIAKRNKDTFTFKYLFRLKKFFCVSPWLVLKLLFTNFDILHIHNVHDGHLIPCILIKLLKRKKIVVTGHNPFIHNTKSKLVKIYQKFLSLFSKYIDTYIALTEDEFLNAKKIIKIADNKIQIIPNSIDNVFFEAKQHKKHDLKEREKYLKDIDTNVELKNYIGIVGWYGRFDKVKNLEILKDAINITQNLLYIFQGPGDENYFKYISKLFKNYQNVYLINKFLHTQDIIKFLDIIDVFVFPSTAESFGLTPIEAMSRKVLTIVSDTTAIGNLMTNQNIGIVIKNQSTEWKKFLKNIENLLKTDENNKSNYISSVIKNYTNFVVQFKSQKVFEQILKCYD